MQQPNSEREELTATDVATAQENYNLLVGGHKRSTDLSDREYAAVRFLYPDLHEAYAKQTAIRELRDARAKYDEKVREALDRIEKASAHTQPSLHDVIESIRKEFNQPNN